MNWLFPMSSKKKESISNFINYLSPTFKLYHSYVFDGVYIEMIWWFSIVIISTTTIVSRTSWKNWPNILSTYRMKVGYIMFFIDLDYSPYTV